MPTVAYTDGACSGNPGPGGWAWAVPGGAHASGAAAHTTNQRMEIEAAYEAVRALPGTLRVVSDSTYVVNCFRDRWWEGWLARGWVNKAKKPVANRDLWEPFIELVRERGDVEFQWIKGHSGDPMNDLVDRLAVEAAETQTGRSGPEPPTDLGAADAPRGARGRAAAARARAARPAVDGDVTDVDLGPPGDARAGLAGARAALVSEPAIAGHTIVVLGHRPTQLGGYDDNPLAEAVRDRVRLILEAKAQLHADLVVVSGLRLGAEMLGAEAALAAGLPVVVVLPYPDPQSVWPTASQLRFADLVEAAQDTVLLQKRGPESKQQAGAALARRDAWLARNVDEALVVWDGKDPGLGRLVRTLEDRLGEDVWIVDPAELATPDHR